MEKLNKENPSSIALLTLTVQVITIMSSVMANNVPSGGRARQPLDCTHARDHIDDCGLRQSFSYVYPEFGFATNVTELQSACRRQSEALKCLKQQSKCLPALSRQVLSVAVMGRTNFNKKLCHSTSSEYANRFMAAYKCVMKSKELMAKGAQAEKYSSILSEAIVRTNLTTTEERLRFSCCAISEIKKQYIDAMKPSCEEYTDIALELVDSYLSEAVGLVCPNYESASSTGAGCGQMSTKLKFDTKPRSRFFVLPVMDAVQSLTHD